MKGSVTVEAACLIPFCMAVMGLICFLGIFQYNQAVLQMTGRECIIRELLENGSSQEQFEQCLAQRALEAGEARVLVIEELEVDVKMTISKISVTYCGKQTIPGIPVEVTVVYERIFPEQTLWLL